MYWICEAWPMTLPPSDFLAAIKSLPRDATVVVERNLPLAHALHGRGFHVVSVGAKSDRVHSVPDISALDDVWSLVSCRNSSAATLGTPELCAAVEKMTTRSFVNANTAALRSRGWVTNLLRNLHHLTKPLGMRLTGLRGMPAFIVGAGSSLDLNAHLLPYAQKRGIVIAVNAAARLEGVDVALTVESNDIRHKLGPLEHVGLRAFGMTADPAVMSHGAGALVPIFAGELGSISEALTGVDRLACSAHGGTAALSLAERWGCDPIVLVGHDFECTDGGLVYPECLQIGQSRAHRDGDRWRFEWDATLAAQPRHNPLNTDELVVEVPALGGGTTTSTMALAGTRRWFETAAANLPGKRLINASERGATIAGWRNQPFVEALAEMMEIPYEVHGAEGMKAEELAGWVEREWAEVKRVQFEALELTKRSTLTLGLDRNMVLLKDSLRLSSLAEPWCQASIAAVMTARREVPMSANAWTEHEAAGQTAREVAAVLCQELPGLMKELNAAAERLSAE